MNPFFLLALGLGACAIFMFLTWLLAQRIHNAGIVDLSWAFGSSLLVMLYMLTSNNNGERQLALASMITFASLRLTWHLGTRFARHWPHEDARYTELKKQMGEDKNGIKLLLIFLWQGLVLTLMSAPFAFVIADAEKSLLLIHWLAISIWLISLVCEAIADQQLASFSQKPENKGKTCQVGLWQYSRHPNYFFEWLSASAYSVFALASPMGFLSVLSSLTLLHFLFNVTGVKPSEEHSMKTRSDYAAYQRTTSVFIPWFRRTT